MADVKICDRCGKSMSKFNSSSFALEPDYYSVVGTILDYLGFYKDKYCNFDFCPECTKELITWIRIGSTAVKDTKE